MPDREKPPRSVAATRGADGLCDVRGRAAIRSTSPITTRNGACRNQRPGDVREAGARRIPGGALLDHHPAQAPGLPQGVRRLRSEEDRALEREEKGRADAGRRHRPQPGQDRGDGGARAHNARPRRQGRASPVIFGALSTAVQFRTPAAAWRRCRPRARFRKPSPRTCAARGGNFVGPTIVYAFMQATGMVNDHLVDCCRHEACRALARELKP